MVLGFELVGDVVFFFVECVEVDCVWVDVV